MDNDDYAESIYILTNQSFPQYINIGYADNINDRLEQLNRNECIPFASRLYASYRVKRILSDFSVHSLIDKLNAMLRRISDFNGKKRVREFYVMSVEDAYSLLESIMAINGLKENLKRSTPAKNRKRRRERSKRNI